MRCRFLRSSPRSRRPCWTSCRSSTIATRAAPWTRTSTCTHTHTRALFLTNDVHFSDRRDPELCVCVLCRSADCLLLPSFDPETVLQTGKYLLLSARPPSDTEEKRRPVSGTHSARFPCSHTHRDHKDAILLQKDVHHVPPQPRVALLQSASRSCESGLAKTNKADALFGQLFITSQASKLCF